MGTYSIEKYSNSERVLQTRQVDTVVFNNPDIIIDYEINTPISNRDKTGDLIITFNKSLDWIVGNYSIGENYKIFKKVTSVNSISKVTKTLADNNGGGNGSNVEVFLNNYIYLSTTTGITSIQISNGAGGGINKFTLKLKTNFPDLTDYISMIPQASDFGFLDALPLIKVLYFRMTAGAGSTFINLLSLKNSNIEVLSLVSYNGENPSNLLNSLPHNLYYLTTTQMPVYTPEISEFFNGNPNRVGLVFEGVQGILKVKYDGNCVFPSVLNDSIYFKSLFIFSIQRPNLPEYIYKITPDQVSKFIVEFANQVTAVNVTNKKIAFMNHTANTSYTDLSQPIYTTYASALTYITVTLGVTVTF